MLGIRLGAVLWLFMVTMRDGTAKLLESDARLRSEINTSCRLETGLDLDIFYTTLRCTPFKTDSCAKG